MKRGSKLWVFELWFVLKQPNMEGSLLKIVVLLLLRKVKSKQNLEKWKEN